MEASLATPMIHATDEAYEHDVEASLPEGEDRASAMLRCDRLLELIREERRREETLGEFVARRIQMIADHGTEELRKIHGRIAHLEDKLRMHVPQTGDGMTREFGKKSLVLPHGVIGFRASPAAVRIVDQKAAVAWARANRVTTQLKTTETVRADDVKAWHERTGEVPDGCEYVDSSESFYVKPKGEE